MDFNLFFSAFSLKHKTHHQHGEDLGVGDDSDKEGVEVQPLPWKNAPKADGSTAEFKQQLEEYQKFMHRFSMHTPHYFLAYDSRAQVSESATAPAQKQVTAKVVRRTVDAGEGRRQRKRKAPEVDEEGWLEYGSLLPELTPY